MKTEGKAWGLRVESALRGACRGAGAIWEVSARLLGYDDQVAKLSSVPAQLLGHAYWEYRVGQERLRGRFAEQVRGELSRSTRVRCPQREVTVDELLEVEEAASAGVSEAESQVLGSALKRGDREAFEGALLKTLRGNRALTRVLQSFEGLPGGTVVGDRFELKQLLGLGGFGAVYEVRDRTRESEAYALKVLHTELRKDAEARARFWREYEALRAIRHSRAVRVYHDGVDPTLGVPWFCMDLVEGETLRDVLDRAGRLGETQAVEVVWGACEVLDAAHRVGLAHRDLKPSNLILGEAGVHVVDFGLAKALGGGSAHETITQRLLLGTPRYASPEVAAGRGAEAGAASDVYSLGVVLYEALTGELPYELRADATQNELVGVIQYGSPRELPVGSRRLKEVVGRALEKYPEDRFANAEELGRALGRRPEASTKRSSGWLRGWFSREETGKAPMGPAPVAPQAASGEFPRLLANEGPIESKGLAATRTEPLVTKVVDEQLSQLERSYREAVKRASKLAGFTLLGVESYRCGALANKIVSYRQEETGLVFRLIPGGSYLIGSPEGLGQPNERRQHEVAVEPFLLCETPCTQGGWDWVAEGEGIGDQRYRKGKELPIEGVNWDDVRRWCTEVGLRLPSEAEWEYACRAGSTGAYCFGESEEELLDYGWFFRNSGTRLLEASTGWGVEKVLGEWGCRTHPVGQKKSNAWGLYDMHGNVREWCEDDWEGTHLSGPSVGWPARKVTSASGRVCRGGSWYYSAFCCRSAHRGWCEPGVRYFDLGFRPARSLP